MENPFYSLKVWLAKRTVEKYLERRTGMKAGIKTSEFWVGMLGIVLAGMMAKGFLPADFPKEAFLVIAGYIISRGIAKIGTGVAQ